MPLNPSPARIELALKLSDMRPDPTSLLTPVDMGTYFLSWHKVERQHM